MLRQDQEPAVPQPVVPEQVVPEVAHEQQQEHAPSPTADASVKTKVVRARAGSSRSHPHPGAEFIEKQTSIVAERESRRAAPISPTDWPYRLCDSSLLPVAGRHGAGADAGRGIRPEQFHALGQALAAGPRRTPRAFAGPDLRVDDRFEPRLQRIRQRDEESGRRIAARQTASQRYRLRQNDDSPRRPGRATTTASRSAGCTRPTARRTQQRRHLTHFDARCSRMPRRTAGRTRCSRQSCSDRRASCRRRSCGRCPCGTCTARRGTREASAACRRAITSRKPAASASDPFSSWTDVTSST